MEVKEGHHNSMCFSNAAPININEDVTTVWHQRKIQWRNDPSFFFRFLEGIHKWNLEGETFSTLCAMKQFSKDLTGPIFGTGI